MKDDEIDTQEETEQRLKKILVAAFNMKPTPLKSVPRRNGESRRAAIKKPKKTA